MNEAVWRVGSWCFHFMVVLWLVALTGCGKAAPGLKPVRLKVDWVPTPGHYGIYYAESKGYFRDAGFDVEIINGRGAPSLANEIGLGSVAVGTTTSDSILRQVARGRSFDLAVPLFCFNPFCLVSLPASGIRRFDELKGKRLGVNVESMVYVQYLKALGDAGIAQEDVVEVPVGWGGTDFLISGRIDALLAYITNHDVELAARGVDIVKITGAELEPPLDGYGLVLAFSGSIARDDSRHMDASEMERLTKAVLRGYAEGARDVDGSVEAMKAREPSLDERKLRLGIRMVADMNASSVATPLTIDRWVPAISDAAREQARALYRMTPLAAKPGRHME